MQQNHRSTRLLGKLVRYGFGGLVLFFGLIQLVPYGRDHANPPVAREPVWDSPQTRELAVRACFDCHSNESEWPWYSNIAPVSWLVQHDVDEGRDKLNFSEWGSNRRGEEEEEWAETIEEGEMPPPIYLLTHLDARLSETERQLLINGLNASASLVSEGD